MSVELSCLIKSQSEIRVPWEKWNVGGTLHYPNFSYNSYLVDQVDDVFPTYEPLENSDDFEDREHPTTKELNPKRFNNLDQVYVNLEQTYLDPIKLMIVLEEPKMYVEASREEKWRRVI